MVIKKLADRLQLTKRWCINSNKNGSNIQGKVGTNNKCIKKLQFIRQEVILSFKFWVRVSCFRTRVNGHS